MREEKESLFFPRIIRAIRVIRGLMFFVFTVLDLLLYLHLQLVVRGINHKINQTRDGLSTQELFVQV
jgi:hypothetical protein